MPHPCLPIHRPSSSRSVRRTWEAVTGQTAASTPRPRRRHRENWTARHGMSVMCGPGSGCADRGAPASRLDGCASIKFAGSPSPKARILSFIARSRGLAGLSARSGQTRRATCQPEKDGPCSPACHCSSFWLGGCGNNRADTTAPIATPDAPPKRFAKIVKWMANIRRQRRVTHLQGFAISKVPHTVGPGA